MPEWLTVTEVAEYAKCHRETVAEALRGRELIGTQRKKGGNWKVRRANVDAWLGETMAVAA